MKGDGCPSAYERWPKCQASSSRHSQPHEPATHDRHGQFRHARDEVGQGNPGGSTRSCFRQLQLVGGHRAGFLAAAAAAGIALGAGALHPLVIYLILTGCASCGLFAGIMALRENRNVKTVRRKLREETENYYIPSPFKQFNLSTGVNESPTLAVGRTGMPPELGTSDVQAAPVGDSQGAESDAGTGGRMILDRAGVRGSHRTFALGIGTLRMMPVRYLRAGAMASRGRRACALTGLRSACADKAIDLSWPRRFIGAPAPGGRPNAEPSSHVIRAEQHLRAEEAL